METTAEMKMNWQIRMKSPIGQQIEYCFDVDSNSKIRYDEYSAGQFEATRKEALEKLKYVKERFCKMKWINLYEIVG